MKITKVAHASILAEAITQLGYKVIAYGDDTLMALTDGKETLLNLNDALHSATAEVQDRFISRRNALYDLSAWTVFGK